MKELASSRRVGVASDTTDTIHRSQTRTVDVSCFNPAVFLAFGRSLEKPLFMNRRDDSIAEDLGPAKSIDQRDGCEHKQLIGYHP